MALLLNVSVAYFVCAFECQLKGSTPPSDDNAL